MDLSEMHHARTADEQGLDDLYGDSVATCSRAQACNRIRHHARMIDLFCRDMGAVSDEESIAQLNLSIRFHQGQMQAAQARYNSF